MAEFTYLKQRPAPTDRWVLPVYKEFLGIKKEILESWKRGVINQLMVHREYSDLVDSRMSVKHSKKGIVPVISLKPVIGFDNEERLREYMDFFATYEFYRYKLVEAVLYNVEADLLLAEKYPDGVPSHMRDGTRKVKSVVFLSNVLKLVISAQRSGVFSLAVFDDLSEEEMRLKEFHIAITERGLGHVVGDYFIETGNLTQDIDTDLIGSFYKYVRKLQASQEE